MKRIVLAVAPVLFAACSIVVDVDRFNAGGSSDDSGASRDVIDNDSADAPIENDATDAGDTPKPGRRPQVFVAGGNVAGTNASSVVRSEVTEAGELTAWEEVDPLPVSSSTCQATRSGNNVFIIGPDFVTTNAITVRFASFDSMGKLSSWSGQKSWPPHNRVMAAASDKYVYAIGGTPDGSPVASPDVYVAAIGSDGAPGTFTAARALPVGRAGGCAVVVNDNLYVMGGYTGEGDGLTTVMRASIGSDGSLGLWAAQGELAYVTTGCAAAAVGKRVFVFGGYGAQDIVQHALIDSMGTIGTWLTGPKMLTQHAYFQAAIAGGYVVVAGGFSGASTASDQVEIAPISESGVGPWRSTTALPKTRVFVSAFGFD